MSLDTIHNTLTTTLLNNVDMALSQTAIQGVQGITVYCMQVSWSNFNLDSTARIIISASNTKQIWTQVESIVPTSVNNSYMLNVEKCGYGFVKIDYSASAGAGSLLVSINGKVI